MSAANLTEVKPRNKTFREESICRDAEMQRCKGAGGHRQSVHIVHAVHAVHVLHVVHVAHVAHAADASRRLSCRTLLSEDAAQHEAAPSGLKRCERLA